MSEAVYHLFNVNHELVATAGLGTSEWEFEVLEPMCHCFLSRYNHFHVWKHNNEHQLVWHRIERDEVPGALLASMTLQGIEYD